MTRRSWPNWSAITSWYSPLSSLNQARWAPSGDQAGARSAAPLVMVRSRTSPFSAGTVKISPRASNTARLPVGERAAFSIRSTASVQWGRAQGKSPSRVTAELARLAARGVHGPQPAAVLEDHAPVAAGQVLAVELLEVGTLIQLAGGRVPGPHVHGQVAVAEEEDRVAHPRRREVVAAVPGQALHVQGRQVDDPDGVALAAAVVAPLHVPALDHLVGHARPVGGVRARVDPRDGQGHRQDGVQADGPQPGRRPRRPGAAAGEDARASRRESSRAPRPAGDARSAAAARRRPTGTTYTSTLPSYSPRKRHHACRRARSGDRSRLRARWSGAGPDPRRGPRSRCRRRGRRRSRWR